MRSPDLHWHDVGDARSAWIGFGPPDGTPVVVVPGLTDGLGPVFEPAVRRAIPPPPTEFSDLRVLVVSHPHPVDPRVTTPELARSLALVLDAVLDQPPALVAGHSMGSMVAQHLASTRPDLAPRLVLSAPVAHPGPALRAHLTRWAELVRQGAWRRFAEEACDASYTGRERHRKRLLLRVFGPPRATHLAARHLALTDACLNHDSRALLPTITAPALVLAATRDPVVEPSDAEEVARLLPNVDVRWFEGLAHGFPEQDHDGYLAALRAFVPGTPAAPRS